MYIANRHMRYRLPIVLQPQATILAVNLGGAVIPAAVRANA